MELGEPGDQGKTATIGMRSTSIRNRDSLWFPGPVSSDAGPSPFSPASGAPSLASATLHHQRRQWMPARRDPQPSPFGIGGHASSSEGDSKAKRTWLGSRWLRPPHRVHDQRLDHPADQVAARWIQAIAHSRCVGHPDGVDVAGRLEPFAVGRAFLERVFRSVLPVALAYGIITSAGATELLAVLDRDASRFRDCSMGWPLLIGAWKRKEQA